MTRNLKVLGLALAAMFALTAVAASVASAQQGTLTSDGPVKLTGSETGAAGSGANALTAFGLRTECAGSSYTGTKVGSTTEGVPSGAKDATIVPKYEQKNCKTFPGEFPTTVDVNNCHYVVHLGETTGGVAGTYGVTFDVVCKNVGEEITVTVFTNATKHAENKPFCILHVPQQTGLKGAHATDTGNGHVDLTGKVEGIKAVKTNGGEDALLCAATETNTASFDIDVTVKGENAAGEETKVSISHP